MAESKGGYFISFEHARREVLQESAESYGRFSFDLSTADWRPEERNFFLISLTGQRNRADCAALATRRRGRTTGGHSYEFSQFVNFAPIDLDRLMNRIPKGARSSVKEREGGRGRWFPPVAWLAFLDQLRMQRPQVSKELGALWERVTAVDHYDMAADIQRISMQRDAIGLSLDIAGMSDVRKKEFKKIYTPSEAREVDSFIDLMDAQLPQERTLVDHDRSVFEGIIAKGESASATFSSGRRHLRVWTVDRGPIERLTGVDLMFLNRDFNSLLLVQYKCMVNQGHLDGWFFRPDKQFKLELARMQETEALIAARSRPTNQLGDLRLDSSSLYFKFCKRLPLTKLNGELAEGMVISMKTAETLLSREADRGNGAVKITYDEANRSMNNTLFATLARDGWIGACGLSPKDYRKILGIRELSNSRSFVVAESTTMLEDSDRTHR